jgi:signal transduction histidine kinase/ActR/RegA family two-component response regulator
VPLHVKGTVHGVMSFATAESGRRLDATDLRVALDLARRAATAIENAQLYWSLQEADRRKDEFLAMLAHELRNPLAPIKNAVHLLRMKGTSSAEWQWARDVIDRQLIQMVRLIDDLMDISRITRNKLELRRERVELEPILKGAVETSRPLIEAAGHTLIVSIPPDPIPLDADLTRMAQVFSNLLNNAAKYTPRGGTIWLRAERGEATVTVTIRDTGIGIPQKMLPRIFDMFTQVDRSQDRSQGGLGIGLTLVRRLVEMHGGTVEARSEGPDQGSEFVVRLPLDPPASGSKPPADEIEPRAGVRHRIVVADDNRDSTETLQILLTMMGHQVHIAENGLDAVTLVEAKRPDLVLLDIGMPTMSGYEVARHIRREPWGQSMVLVAVTGWGQEGDRRRSREAGFDHHLVKPVDPIALQSVLAAMPTGVPSPGMLAK